MMPCLVTTDAMIADMGISFCTMHCALYIVSVGGMGMGM